MDCSRPGSSVHGISQARKLEWVTTSSSRRPSHPRDRTHTSCLVDRFLTTEPLGKQPHKSYSAIKGTIYCYTQQPGWSSSKVYKLCDFICITFLKWQDDQNGKQTNNWEELRKDQSRRAGGMAMKRAIRVTPVVMKGPVLIVSVSVSWLWYCTIVLRDGVFGGKFSTETCPLLLI